VAFIKLKGPQPRETGDEAHKEPARDKLEIIKENIPLQIHNSRSIVRCCSPQLRSAATIRTPGYHMQQVSRSVQVKNVNGNAMDMFDVVTTVQQIMTELSGAATGEEKLPS
jgi:hypothetical protein